MIRFQIRKKNIEQISFAFVSKNFYRDELYHSQAHNANILGCAMLCCGKVFLLRDENASVCAYDKCFGLR